MADSDLSTSISALKTKIVNGIPTANVNELVSLARAVKALNLGEDKSLEDAINARANALIGSASADDVARLAGAIKQVLNPASITVTTLSTITGDLIPDQNIVHDLGSSTNRFKDLHLSGNTAVIGDSKISDDGTGIDIRDTSGNPRTIKAKEVTIDDGTGNPIKMKRGAGNTIQFLDSSDNSIETQEQASAPAMSAYNLLSQLPTSGVNTGTQAYVAENNKLYLFNGTGWYNIALISNPITAVTGNAATYELANDGTPLSITLSSSDPDGIPLQWSHQVTSGSLGGTTITNVNNVFTITPSTDPADGNPVTIAFIATNGENQETSSSTFSIIFDTSPNWTTSQAHGYRKYSTGSWPAGTQFRRRMGKRVVTNLNGEYTVASSGEDPYTDGHVQVWHNADLVNANGWGEQFTVMGFASQYSWGCDIDIDDAGETIVFGMPGLNDGRFYVYTRSGTTWSQLQYVDGTASYGDDFGFSVAISGDGLTLAIAAPNYNNNKGQINFFSRPDKSSNFTFFQSLAPSRNTRTNSYLGGGLYAEGALELNTDGTRCVIGQPRYNDPTGRAWLLTRDDSSSSWPNNDTYIKYFEGGDNTGHDVSISGDGLTMAVGNYKLSNGVVRIFDLTTLPSGRLLTTTDTIGWPGQMSSGARFSNHRYHGRAVSLNDTGKTLVTSALTYNASYLAAFGNAYVYRYDGSSWSLVKFLEPSDTSQEDDFAYDISISGNGEYVVVGEPFSNAGTTENGALYLYKGYD